MNTRNLIEQFVAAGGRIKQVQMGEVGINEGKRLCLCGCNGVMAEHQKREQKKRVFNKDFSRS